MFFCWVIILLGICVACYYLIPEPQYVLKKAKPKEKPHESYSIVKVNNIDYDDISYQKVPNSILSYVDFEYPIYERQNKLDKHLYFLFGDSILKINKITKQESHVKPGGYEETVIKMLRHKKFPEVNAKYIDIVVELSH